MVHEDDLLNLTYKDIDEKSGVFPSLVEKIANPSVVCLSKKKEDIKMSNHNDQESVKIFFMCDFCGQSFEEKGLFETHVVMHKMEIDGKDEKVEKSNILPDKEWLTLTNDDLKIQFDSTNEEILENVDVKIINERDKDFFNDKSTESVELL